MLRFYNWSKYFYRWGKNSLVNILATPNGFKFCFKSFKKLINPGHVYELSGGLISCKDLLIQKLKDKDAVIIGSENIDKEVLDSCPNLKLIVRFGSGLEKVDEDYASYKGIKVINYKSKETIKSVANLCLSFSLSYIFNFHEHHKDNKSEQWVRHINKSAENVRIGLIGFGDIAQRFYKIASKVGFKFSYFSRNQRKKETIPYHSSLEELIELNDIISIHLPSDKNTENMIKKEHLALMKSKALINTSRANIINKVDLYNSLSKNIPKMFYTDVLHNEPPTSVDFNTLSLPNILSTSHIGGYSENALKDVTAFCIKQINEQL